MRLAARALVSILIVVACRDAGAVESGSKWWPFAKHTEPTVAQPADVGGNSAPLAAAVPPQPNTAETASPPKASGPVSFKVQLPQLSDEPDPPLKSSIRWPHPKMPELPKPHLPKMGSVAAKSTPESSRNTWVEKVPAPPKPSPLQSMKNGTHRVADGTKKAWHKTVAALTPGDQSKPETGSRLARRQTQPPFWKRMLGAKEPELQQPQTVPQWMAQKRLDP